MKAAALTLGLGGSAAPPRLDLPGPFPETQLLLSVWKSRLNVLQARCKWQGRAPWYRVEFQGELPGRCCRLAQWAAGFSRDEGVLHLIRLWLVEGMLRLRSPWMLIMHRNPMGQDPYIAGWEAWTPGSPCCKTSGPGLVST